MEARDLNIKHTVNLMQIVYFLIYFPFTDERLLPDSWWICKWCHILFLSSFLLIIAQKKIIFDYVVIRV